VTSFVHGLITVTLIASCMYILTVPQSAQRTVLPAVSDAAYTQNAYTPDQTYGGSNPVETCDFCDIWGKPDTGTSSPPTTDPNQLVNTATGDLAESYTLFSDPNPGFNLQFKLTYDSLTAQLATYYQEVLGTNVAGPYGWGWRADGGDAGVSLQSGYDAVVLASGAELDFYPAALTGPQCPIANTSLKWATGSPTQWCGADWIDAEFGTSPNVPGASYELYEHGGRQVIYYDANGNVLYEGDVNDQNSITYEMNTPVSENGCPAIGLTTECTVAFDRLGRYYAVAFNGGARAIGVQDPTGQFWGFNYNANQDLVLVADPLSHAWGFGYSGSGAGSPLQNDLNSIGDPDGNTTMVGYTLAGTNGGLVSSVTDALGNITSFSGWNVLYQQGGNSYVTTVINPDGQTVAYQYSTYQLQLVTVTAADGDSHYTATTEYVYGGTYTNPVEDIYDPLKKETIDTTDEVGNIITQSNSYGTTTTYYNPFDEPCWTAPPGVTIPPNPGCYTYPNAGTGVTLFFYDAYGNLNREIDPDGNYTYSAYDAYGDLCWQTVPGTVVGTPPPCSAPPATSTRYSYNAGEELLSESTPDGSGTTYSYDTTTYTYNNYGEVLTTITPDGYVAGNTPAEYTTTNYYDNAGRLDKVVGPMARTTTIVLDAAGNVDSVTDPAGQVTSAGYDPLNRMCWSLQAAASSVCQSDPAGSTRYNDFANTDLPSMVEDPDNNITHYAYGNPDVPSSPTTITDALGNITSNVYDLDGNLCVTGAETTSLYGATDPTCSWTKGYTYDTFDQLGNVVTSEDPSGNTTTYTRGNPAFPNDVTTSTPASGGGQGATSYHYDFDGRLITTVEGNGNAVTTTYTATGQKCWQAPVNQPTSTCSTAPPTVAGTSAWLYNYSQLPYFMTDETAGASRYTAWTYDAQGQELAQASSTAGEVQYTYDPAGDNTCVAYPVSTTSTCSSAASATNTVVNYGFDADGRMTSMTDWLGNSFTFGYDTRSNLTSIKYPASTTWTENLGPYDPANNLPTLSLSSPTYGTAAIGYTSNADEDYSNEAGTSYNYNAKIQVTTAGTHALVYNPNGEIASDTSGSTATSFAYNTDDELTSKKIGTSTTSYNYDANGNRCASATGTATPSCAPAIIGSSLDGYNAYNQLCYTTGAITIAITTPTCSAPPVGATTYAYDGDGLRVSSTTPLGVTQYFDYNTQTRPGQPLIIKDGASAYLYGPAEFGSGTAPLEQISTVGAASYLVNAPTGVAESFSSTGAVSGTETYSAYGSKTVSGTITSPFGYQGAYTDPSGLIYLIDRYYDPSTDQFISVDPDLAETDQPYAFTEDDPVNRSDPLGLMPGCGGQVGSCVQSSPGHPEVTVPTPAQLAPVEASEAATAAVESGSNSSTKAVTVVLLPVVVNTCPGDNGCTGPLHMIPYDGPPYNPPLAKPPSGGGFFLIRILNFLSGVLTYADGCATGGSYGVAIGAAIPIADVTGVSELAGGLVGCGVGIYGVQQGGLQPGAPTPDNPTGST
jgi:RHS repeat-associated protein